MKLERGTITEEDEVDDDLQDLSDPEASPIVARSREIQTRLFEKPYPKTFTWQDPLAPFHPNHRWRMIWTVVLMAVITIECIWLPMDLAFETFERPEAFGYGIVYLFMIDMVFTCNTAIYDDGELCTRRKDILRHYVKTGAVFIDGLSSFPFFLVAKAIEGNNGEYGAAAGGKVAQSAGKLLHTLRLLRIGRVRALMESCIEIFPIQVLNAIDGLGLFALLVIACHWSACLFWYTSTLDRDVTYIAQIAPWTHQEVASGWDKFSLQYLQAVLWSMTTLTRGNTDLIQSFSVTSTVGDRIFQTAAESCAFVLSLYLIASWVGTYSHKNQEKENFKFEKAGIRMLMCQRNVPSEVQVRVRQQMELEFSYRQIRVMEAARFDVIRRLTPQVRMDFYSALNKSTLVRHPFFVALPKRPLYRLCELAEAILFRDGDIVCKRGHAAQTMFFIVIGELEIVFEEGEPLETCDMSSVNSTSIAAKIRVSAPSWVGDQCLFVEDARRVCTLLAAVNSELLSLSRACLLDILLEFPSVRPHYLEMKRCIENGQLEYAGIVCSVCKKPGHNVTSCPMVNKKYEEDLKRREGWVEHFARSLTSRVKSISATAEKVRDGLRKSLTNNPRRSKTWDPRVTPDEEWTSPAAATP